MANQSGSNDKAGRDIRDISGSDREQNTGSGSSSSSKMNIGESTYGMRNSGSGSKMNSPHPSPTSDEMGPMHTNAGNTGFSSDQISPKTQNLPQTGPSASHPARNKDESSSDR